jgi:hypothetical protein
MHRLALSTALLGALACRPAPVVEDAPAAWSAPTEIPEAPVDPDAPMARMLWMMQYDNRDFDATWAFLQQTATPGPQRDLALGAAAFLAVFELSRIDVLDAGVEALDRAIAAYPDDARLPLWRAMFVWKATYLDPDATPAEVDATYDELRRTGEDYAGFTLFGLTMSIAADLHAGPALLDEAVQAYEDVVDATLSYQVGDEGWRAERLGDWAHVPYNIPGTNILNGDVLLMAGDLEGAQRKYWEAMNTNLGYAWPFRAQADARLSRLEEIQAGLLADPPTEWAYGAGWRGARGSTRPSPSTASRAVSATGRARSATRRSRPSTATPWRPRRSATCASASSSPRASTRRSPSSSASTAPSPRNALPASTWARCASGIA